MTDHIPSGANAQIPFPDEIAHLKWIEQRIADALGEAENSVRQLEQEYRITKQYMVQHRSEIDPHEMLQHEQMLIRIDRSGAFAIANRDRVIKLMDSPYFARIDFAEGQDGTPCPYYIGRFAFSDAQQLQIIDWRAPIAGLFYDFEVGCAHYLAPHGRIDGDLTRKRQFKIRQGIMEYALETSGSMQDDVLQRELALNSDDRMKSIISTIQKEQNAIIRSDISQTMVIQGVAGSGKTSIALHRIAFLLYRFKQRLTAEHVAILSPSRIFGDYISGVLPELGEQPILSLGLADIAKAQLDGVIDFDQEPSPSKAQHAAQATRARTKATPAFLQAMDDFVQDLANIAFEAREYRYEAHHVSAQWISARLNQYKNTPFMQRLSMIADDIHDRFESENYLSDRLPPPRTILKALKSMRKIKSTLVLYRTFIKQLDSPKLFIMAGSGRIEWSDVYPFIYLHAAFFGLQNVGRVRHLVIDEMQDYTPIQLAVIHRIYPCQKTILGDFGQSIHPIHCHTLEDLMRVYPDARLVTLTKSYRSTCEIIRFARQFCPEIEIDVIDRHGPEPEVIQCQSKQEQLAILHQAIDRVRSGIHASLGILLKTDEQVQALWDQITDRTGIQRITEDTDTFEGPIHIASIRMAKGLEFDEVVIMDADAPGDGSDQDRRLLYVACTRAMHRLTLLRTRSHHSIKREP
ncbi:ATP-binding domain-containing protein [Eubacteriales bacterium OttesenSCG-928-N13]|nr:ATP-binding domain-containing protein [Eubacteriales bacterium OttesenSCG-928-N13]